MNEITATFSLFSIHRALQPVSQLLVAVITVALVLAPIPSFAQSQNEEPQIAGNVISAVGDVIARDSSGGDRNLRRRSAVFEGETLFTGPNSSAQIRMSDAALISLKADTAFTLVAYQYEDAIETDSVVLELVEGGFRTITGAVGSQKREAYKARVAGFATIGIRGTDFEVSITPQGTMFTGVYDGGTRVFNNGGNLNLGVNADYDFARVDGPDVPPEGLMVEPLELGQVTIEAVDETDADDDGDNTQAANVDANGADSGNDTQAANNDAIGADNQSAPNNIAANLGPNTLAASATPAAANNTPVQTPASNNNNANSVQSPLLQHHHLARSPELSLCQQPQPQIQLQLSKPLPITRRLSIARKLTQTNSVMVWFLAQAMGLYAKTPRIHSLNHQHLSLSPNHNLNLNPSLSQSLNHNLSLNHSLSHNLNPSLNLNHNLNHNLSLNLSLNLNHNLSLNQS